MRVLLLTLCYVGWMLSPSHVYADDAGKKADTGGGVEIAAVLRASSLVGLPVRNTVGKDLGKVEDLVVDLNSAKVRYAALSYGGILGVGDKLFAIPFKAMTFKFGEKDKYFLVDVPQEKLDKSPGFDKKNWPDFADKVWVEKIDKYYELKSDTEKVTREKTAPGEVVYDAAYRVSSIKGMNVKNEAGKDLGEIHDLVIDLKEGKVRYAALSFGGILGLGDKLFAVPFSAIRLKHDGDKKYFVTNISYETLKRATGFDKNNWPNTADPKWSSDLDRFYDVSQAPAKSTTKSVK